MQTHTSPRGTASGAQEAMLFSRTIRENLLLADPQADELAHGESALGEEHHAHVGGAAPGDPRA